MRLVTTLLVSAAVAGVSQAVLDNYYLFNNGDAYWINKLRDIAVPNRWVIKRPWGTAPRHCVATAIDNGFCVPTDLEVFDIYYADVCTYLNKFTAGSHGKLTKIVPRSMDGLPLQ